MTRRYEHIEKIQKPIDAPASLTISFSLTFPASFDKMVLPIIIDNRQPKEVMP